MCSWLFNKYIKCTEVGKKDLLICRVVTPKYMFNEKKREKYQKYMYVKNPFKVTVK